VIDIPIVDTHLHIWDPANLRYFWLDDVPKLNKPHLPADYSKATEGLSIEKLVFIQSECDSSLSTEEVRWVTEQAG
jgi:L-fuconolactonase